MKTHFENKEQYFAFRAAWASAVKDDRAKNTLNFFKHKPWGHTEEVTSCERRSGWIHGTHHILFNILRGKPYDTGFTPITNKVKLANGMNKNAALNISLSALHSAIKIAKENGKDAPLHGYYFDRMQDVLKPFNGTVTMEMLANIDLDAEMNTPTNVKEAA